jgi:hypothetical protein
MAEQTIVYSYEEPLINQRNCRYEGTTKVPPFKKENEEDLNA